MRGQVSHLIPRPATSGSDVLSQMTETSCTHSGHMLLQAKADDNVTPSRQTCSMAAMMSENQKDAWGTDCSAVIGEVLTAC